MQLTKRQKRFCREYLKDLNGTQAAIRAGYSKRSANEQAARMLAKDSIKACVAAEMAQRAKRTEITADYVLRGIREVVEAKNVKHTDRLKGLELLGRHLAMFVDRTHVGGDDKPVPIKVVKEYVKSKTP